MSFLGDTWDDVTSFLGDLFGGDPDGPDFLAMGIAETGVIPSTPQTSFLIPDIGLPHMPGRDIPGGPIEIPDEDEDDPLAEEKKAAALAARALQAREEGRSGRSSTFLTRGMDLGIAPARKRALLGQGW